MQKNTLIAIGASAGGIAALYDFFDNTLPDDVSYVVTMHLYAHEKSLLTDLIQKHSAIEVCEVEDKMQIVPDKVYVMPENKVMTIKSDQLLLTPRDLSLKVNMAIDIFFNSLATINDFNVIAIILSGLGKDGTNGIEAISKNGGVIIAQELATAKNESMPQGVIDSGYADFILNAKEMPAQVIKSVIGFG